MGMRGVATLAVIREITACGQYGQFFEDVTEELHYDISSCEGCAGLCCNEGHKYFSYLAQSSTYSEVCYCFGPNAHEVAYNPAFTGGTCYSVTGENATVV